MKNVFLWCAFAVSITTCAQNQSADAVINVKEVTRIESVLASDSMQGRQAGTPSIDKAAHFIADEFKKVGLQPLKEGTYLQEFSMLHPTLISLKGEVDGVELESRNVVVLTSQSSLNVTETSGYDVQNIKATDNYVSLIEPLVQAKKNTVVFIDPAFTRNFIRLNYIKRQIFKSPNTVIFILGSYQPKKFTVKAEHSFTEQKLTNVVGILPGKKKASEYVVFSGHYDHLGIGRAVDGDSIYNGANDDAAGTTAVIMLANYYKKLNNNERTLVFAAFTAEEIGGFGSQYFSRQFNPEQVKAMFNIEMIGTESKWGKNSAYITGFDKTNMGKILQKNLKGSSFTFHPDPYVQENLFYRSDNATLARLGVPAHTISTSKMDNEPNYHKPSDEVNTLDMDNMTQIIKAIAVSAKSIVAGKDTPDRVKPETL